MHSESEEHECGRHRDDNRQPRGPAPAHPQADAGDDVGEPGQKIEPEHEGHIVAGGLARRAVDKQNGAALPKSEQTEADRKQEISQCQMLRCG